MVPKIDCRSSEAGVGLSCKKMAGARAAGADLLFLIIAAKPQRAD